MDITVDTGVSTVVRIILAPSLMVIVSLVV